LRALREESGSTLVETALGVALILGIALPFASLVSYTTYLARDLAAAQSAARTAARTESASSADPRIQFTCGADPSSAGTCVGTLQRGSYVAAARDSAVELPFGLELHTNGRAVARVE